MSGDNRFVRFFVYEWQLKVAALVLAIIVFFIYNVISLEERYLTIPLEVKLDADMVSSDVLPEVVKLTVRGKSEEIYLFSDNDFKAIADFSAYKIPGRYAVPIAVVPGRSAATITHIQTDPTPKTLSLTIDQSFTRSVEVVPHVVGYPARGFEIIERRVEPATLKIQGPETIVSLMESVSTIPVDVAGQHSSFSILAEAVSENKTVKFPEGNIVRLNFVISEVISERVFAPVPIEVDGVPGTLTLKIEPEVGRLKLKATQNVMDTVDRTRPVLRVNLSGLRRAGTFTVPAVPDVPEKTSVIEFEPLEVTVTLTERE